MGDQGSTQGNCEVPCWWLGAGCQGDAVSAQLQLAPGMSLGCVGTPLHSGGDMGTVTVPFFKWFCVIPFRNPLGFGVFVPVVSLGSAQKQRAPVPASSSSTGHRGQLLGPTDELCCCGAGSNCWECGFLPCSSPHSGTGQLVGVAVKDPELVFYSS